MRWIVIVSAIFLGVYWLATGVPVAALSWSGGSVSFERGQTSVSLEASAPCAGEYSDINIASGKVTACLQGNEGGVRIASYIGSQGWTYAVAFPLDREYTPLWVCTGQPGCVYVPATDTFLAYSYISNLQKGMIAFTGFSRKLVKHSDPFTLKSYFAYEGVGADFSLRHGSGQVLPVSAMAASANGNWLAVEVHNYGMILVRNGSWEIRRVSAPGTSHGYGATPQVELAVSNDGRAMAVMGWRMGLSLIEIDDSCGDRLGAEAATWFAGDITPCQQITPNLESVGGSYSVALHPRFDSIGSFLSFKVLFTNTGWEQILMGAPGQVKPTLDYLALGDSFSSGEGESDDRYYKEHTDDKYERCHTSTRSYPYLLARSWGSGVQSIACSGATTIDLVATSGYFGQGWRLAGAGRALSAERVAVEQAEALSRFIPGRRPQLDFLRRYKPTVVTVGIGGNDAGLVAKLADCIGPTTCEWAATATARYQTAKEVSSLYGRLVGLYNSMQQLAPSSSIIAIGYPRIIDTRADCSWLNGALLDVAERQFIDETLKYLNAVIEAAAAASGVLYANISDSYLNSQLCDDAPVPAMNGLRRGDDIAPIFGLPTVKIIGNESFHPTAFGHELTAATILGQYPLPPLKCLVCDQPTELPAIAADYWGSGEDAVQQMQVNLASLTEVSRGASLAVAAPGGTFATGSQVVVEIHSSFQTLGQLEASSDGGLVGEVSFPDSLPDGQYAIHFVGRSYSDEPVDVYQFLTYLTPPPTESNPAPVQEVVVKPNHHIDSIFIGSKSLAETKSLPDSSEVLGESKTPLSRPPSQNLSLYGWFWLLGAALGVAIIVAFILKWLSRYPGG